MRQLEAVRKGRPQSGRGELYSAEGFFRCRSPQFLMQKTSEFSNFMLGQNRQERTGFEPVRTFVESGEGSFFAILCGRPLWTTPYKARSHLIAVRIAIQCCYHKAVASKAAQSFDVLQWAYNKIK